MKEKATTTLLAVLLAFGIALASAVFPRESPADIYRWVDDAGGVHFTDDPGAIPEKFRTRQHQILKGPPPSGQPSLSTMERPGGMSVPPSEPSLPGVDPSVISGGGPDPVAQAEELRAKIAAKERFVETVDRKRSTILNPLGNRFVSPEDLELYRKYKEDLPGDRQRLREFESSPAR